MGQITEKTLTEIMLHLNENGEPATLEKYGMKQSTLERYRRKARFDTTKPKNILLLDIETSPLQVFVWQLFGNKYISHDNIIRDTHLISWSAKWLFATETLSDVQTPEEAIAGDDKRIIGSMWKLLNQADVTVGHNSRKFDHKHINTRLIMNGYGPTNPHLVIDTLEVAKKNFRFTSNRLDYLGKIMKNKQKLETNFKLWTDCIAGDKDALKRMEEYNRMDVILLEDVFMELRPWIKSGINVSIIQGGETPSCSICGGIDLSDAGDYYTTANRYHTYRCNNCGALSRERISDITKEERKALLVPVAR